MTDPAEHVDLDERDLDEAEIAEEIRRRERLLLRWPLLVGTAAVLYGSLMVIYIVIRLLSFLYIYMILSDLPPSGSLLFAQVFPLVDGFFLGGMLFVAGIVTLRRRLLGPRLLNLWSLLMLVAAFVGREPMLAAYRHAVEAGFRFYSYGDAMLILSDRERTTGARS